MKILLTGGAGYIGSILTELLLSNGYEVTVLDNFMFRQNSLNNLFFNKNLKVIDGDIRNASLIRKETAKHDVIIPLAAIVGAPACEKYKFISKDINYTSNLNIIKCKSKNQIVLMPTTNSAYGSGDSDNHCNEDSPLNPLSDYAIQKVNLEKEILQFENVFSFRFATVFGFSPKMRFDLLVNDFTQKAYLDKYIVLFEENFKRNFLHIRDAANVFMHALNSLENFKHNIFNVGLSEANISKKDLCQKIQNHIPDFIFKTSSISSDPDKRNYIVDNSRIESTGFKCMFDLDEGILELIKGIKTLSMRRYTNIS
tara:strand:- start:7281 stop:8216 length:936 start_codon:yes stop_codon:yes gene_type:complete